ncbi:BZ3500_MvSof-1268-A1-R1_C066g00326 [Microbotryum saponariae]|uniref:BZ3500_MvSof-1268-A1-R1_C066g00326 protein n=1 Tax=Microbotryum saponariae TaxID=289078 RepID=A0A2X0LAU0_9BASI|nr:BZ3500_MvSof-1268-A1-R1_C066g00326 [Microbotryum saponariae]
MIETLLSATKTPAARNRPSPRRPNPTTATALSSLESRLEESEARRIDSEARVQQLEKLVEVYVYAGEMVPLDVPPHTILERSGNTADPLVRSPGGESHSARRDGPSSAVISSRWRGTLPDREGLWTGDNPDRLVTFTTFGKSYLSLLCDISTSDLFTTDRVIQLVATLFVRSTSPKRRQSPHDWAVDTMTDALRDERPHCWTTLMTEVGRRWPDPGFADRVSHDFYGCRQSSSRAYDHPLVQLATTFYQSLSDVAKREVRAGMLREYRDNSLVTIGRFGRTVPSLEEVTDWAAIADDTGTTSVSTPPIRTATYGAIAKTPRTAPSTPNDDARTQIRRARWMNRAASGGVPASMACFNCGQGGHFSQHCTAERQSPSTVQISAIAFADMDEDDGRRPQVTLRTPRSTSSHDSLADIAIDAVEDVLYYADGRVALVSLSGAGSVSSRKAEKDCSVSSFQILVPSGVSLLASAAPLIDIDEPDRPSSPPLYAPATSSLGRYLLEGFLRCLIDSGSEVDLVDQEVVRVDPSFATARLTAPLHLRLGTQDKSDRCAVFARSFFVWRPRSSFATILRLPHARWLGRLHRRAHRPSQPVAQDTHEWDQAVTVAPILSSSALAAITLGCFPTTRSSASSHTTRCSMSSTIRRSTIFSESEARTRLAALLEKFSDVFVDSLPMDQLPPYRPVNHEIPLIDPTGKSQWAEHSAKYTRGRFWVSGPIDSAAPVFAHSEEELPDGSFRDRPPLRATATPSSVFRPSPDMTNVRYEVARSRYRSKFDVAAAFEQVRVIPEHVDRTGFATVTGTYTSRVMQLVTPMRPILNL